MDSCRLPNYLSSTNLVDGGIWEDLDKDGETKNTLSFDMYTWSCGAVTQL
jgi:hypothetical protein